MGWKSMSEVFRSRSQSPCSESVVPHHESRVRTSLRRLLGRRAKRCHQQQSGFIHVPASASFVAESVWHSLQAARPSQDMAAPRSTEIDIDIGKREDKASQALQTASLREMPRLEKPKRKLSAPMLLQKMVWCTSADDAVMPTKTLCESWENLEASILTTQGSDMSARFSDLRANGPEPMEFLFFPSCPDDLVVNTLEINQFRRRANIASGGATTQSEPSATTSDLDSIRVGRTLVTDMPPLFTPRLSIST